jgi:hypothetical protein
MTSILQQSSPDRMEAAVENEHWEHRRVRLDQAVCAWALVLVLAMLFAIANIIWPKQPAIFQLREIDVEQTDSEQTAEVQHWERGAPRQGLRSRKSVWLSRVDP